MNLKKKYSLIICINLLFIVFYSFNLQSIPIYGEDQQSILRTSTTITEKWKYSVSQNIELMKMSENGRYLCTLIGNNLTLFDNENNDTLINREMSVTTFDLSSTGEYLVIGDDLGKITLFNCKSTNIKVEWIYEAGSLIRSVAISDDGKYVVASDMWSGLSEGYIYLFNTTITSPKTYEWRYDIYADAVKVDIGHDTKDDIYYISAGNYNDEIIFLNNTHDTPKTPMWEYTINGLIRELEMSKDGNYLAVRCDETERLYTFNKSTQEDQPTMGYYPYILCDDLALSPDGSYVVVGSHGEDMTYLFNMSLNEPLWKSEAGGDINSVGISLNGEYILSGSSDEHLYLFNKSSNNTIWTYNAVGPISLVSISSNGEYFACVILNNEIVLFHNEIPTIPPQAPNSDNNPFPFIPVIILVFITSASVLSITMIILNRKKHRSKK